MLIKDADNIGNFNLGKECEIANVRKVLTDQFIGEWKQSMLRKPKLGTYVKVKHSFCAELYVKQTICRSRRSFLAQFRLRILPLELETGRYTPIYDKFTTLNRKRHPSERFM